MARIIYRIVTAGVCMFLCLWLGSIFFNNSIIIRAYDKDLGRMVNRPDQWVEFRTEGYATSYVGLHGITGVRSFSPADPKVLVWGDSHVEAWQVKDSDKIAAQVNQQLAQSSRTLKAFGIGEAGVSWAQHYFDIPRYEKVLGNVQHHYIVVGGMGRVLPSKGVQSVNQYAQFVERDGEYELLDRTESQTKVKRLIPVLNQLELRFIYTFISKIRNGKLGKLSFQVGPRSQQKIQPGQPSQESDSPDTREKALCWLFRKMKTQTVAPITLVYAPATPSIRNGHIVFLSQERDSDVEVLKRACSNSGISFIDMRIAFEDEYKLTGHFSRGFFNTPPASGHFNAEGQRVLADRIFRDLAVKGL